MEESVLIRTQKLTLKGDSVTPHYSFHNKCRVSWQFYWSLHCEIK